MSAPPTPTISAVFDDANSVVHLTVTSSGAASVVVTHSVNSGAAVKVRYSDEATPGTGGVFLIDDHEAPQRGSVAYSAMAYDSAGNASAASPTVTLSLFGTSFWLKDPISPSLSMKLRLDQVELTYKKVRQQVTFTPLRGNRKYVLNGPMLGHEFDALTVLLYDNNEFNALESLLDNGNTLILKLDDGRFFYVRVGAEVSYADLVTTQRLTKPLRRVTIPLIETSAP